MALRVRQLSLDTIAQLRPLAQRIAQRDRSLATQLRRAASSFVLNIGEAEYSDPGNRRARLHSAAGSAGETRAAIQAALAWRYIGESESASALDGLDHLIASLWRLNRK